MSPYFQLRSRARSAVVGTALLSGASLLALRPGQARACSCAAPFQNELRVGNGRIPSNAAGVTWWFPSNRSSEPLESFVTLERQQGEQLRPVSAVVEPFEGVYLIRPAARWSEGDRYRISVDAGASNGSPEQRFRVVEFEVSGPLEAGGALSLTASSEQRSKLTLVDFGGSCAAQHDAAFVDVFSSWTIEDFPQGILFFDTYVDGQRWQPKEALCQSLEPGTSWLGRSRDRIVADCSGTAEPAVALPLGAHQVRIEARLPGTSIAFSTDEQWVGLFCRDESERRPPGVQSADTPRAVLPLPSGAEPEPQSAAVAPALDLGAADPGSPRASAGGGGCTLSRASGEDRSGYTAVGPLALLALLALGGQRRRSRESVQR